MSAATEALTSNQILEVLVVQNNFIRRLHFDLSRRNYLQLVLITFVFSHFRFLYCLAELDIKLNFTRVVRVLCMHCPEHLVCR